MSTTNKITVQEYIAKEALRGLYNSSTLIGNCDRKYTKNFGNSDNMIGRKLLVKKPARFLATDGRTYQPQNIVEETVDVTVGEPTGVHFELDLLEASLDISQDKAEYSKRVLMPAGRALGAKVESRGFAHLASNVNGTILLSADATLKNFNFAKAILEKNLAPKGNRVCIIGSDSEVALTDSLKTLYHSQALVEAAIKKGEMTDAVGLRWLGSELTHIHTNGGGTGKTITFTVPGTTSTSTLTMGGADYASAKVGDGIKLGVKLVNAETKEVTSLEAQRTIVAIDGTTATLSEPIVWSGLGQNVSAKPTSISFIGTAGVSYQVDIVYHQDAIALVNPDLYVPKNMEMSYRTEGEFNPNLSMLFTRGYNDGDMTLRNRLDGLFTWKVMRPEWGVRVMTPLT